MTLLRHNWRHDVWINYLCGPSRHAIQEAIVLEDRLVQVRTLGEEAFERLKIMISWHPQYDVIRTPDVIGDVTIRSSICDFLSGTNRDQTLTSLSFWDIKLWKFLCDDVSSDVTCLDRLSVWIVWTHYAVDDYVTIWSNLDKNWRRRSILKGVMTS